MCFLSLLEYAPFACKIVHRLATSLLRTHLWQAVRFLRVYADGESYQYIDVYTYIAKKCIAQYPFWIYSLYRIHQGDKLDVNEVQARTSPFQRVTFEERSMRVYAFKELPIRYRSYTIYHSFELQWNSIVFFNISFHPVLLRT